MTLLSGDGIHRSMSGNLRAEEYRGRTVVGWLHPHMIKTLAMLLDRYQVKTVIEVGSFLGLSACWFAERVDEVVCVDLFNRNMMSPTMQIAMAKAGDEHLDNMYDVFLANTKAYPNISSYKMDSLKAATELDVTADLVYLDADHSYEGVSADIAAWTPHARKVICGDDNTAQWPSVTRAATEIGANTDERIWWLAL